MRHVKETLIAIAVATLAASVAAAQEGPTFSLAVEPIYPIKQERAIYAPLAQVLSRAAGQDVALLEPKRYSGYWHDVRTGTDADIAFDSVHLADFRIRHYQYDPLVCGNRDQPYHLVVASQSQVLTSRELVGRKIGTLPAPSLSQVSAIEAFPKTADLDIRSDYDSYQQLVNALLVGDVDAIAIPAAFLEQHAGIGLRTVYRSRSFPAPVLSVSPRVSHEMRARIRDALLALGQDDIGKSLALDLGLSRFTVCTGRDISGNQKALDLFFYTM